MRKDRRKTTPRVLHQDNARDFIMLQFHKEKHGVIPHPPYSPDLALPYHLSKMKRKMSEKI